MIMDGLLMFDGTPAASGAPTPSSLAIAPGSQASANVIDLGTQRDLGVDAEMKVLVQVVEAFAGGTSLQVFLQGSTDNSAYTTMAESRAYPTAELTAGTRLLAIALPRPAGSQAIPRYLRLNYTVAGTMTAGTVIAGLVLDRHDSPVYPSNISVSAI